MFVSERGALFTTAGFARMLERAAVSARLDIKMHPHMLRHACSFALANQGRDTRGLQAYLGHRYIQHTARYTELSSVSKFCGAAGSSITLPLHRAHAVGHRDTHACALVHDEPPLPPCGPQHELLPVEHNLGSSIPTLPWSVNWRQNH